MSHPIAQSSKWLILKSKSTRVRVQAFDSIRAFGDAPSVMLCRAGRGADSYTRKDQLSRLGIGIRRPGLGRGRRNAAFQEFHSPALRGIRPAPLQACHQYLDIYQQKVYISNCWFVSGIARVIASKSIYRAQALLTWRQSIGLMASCRSLISPQYRVVWKSQEGEILQ